MTYDIISTRRFKKELRIKQPIDIFFIVKKYAKSRQEQFLLLTLNGAHAVIAIHIVTIGIANRTIIHPREIFYHAIKDNACALAFAHNHPTGELEASQNDEEITERLVKASKIMGFHIVDHIIFNKRNWFSMRENGFSFN